MSVISWRAIILTFLTVVISGSILSPILGQRFSAYKSKNTRLAIYTQWIDHFNIEAGTFDQTIYINDQFYQLGGPVFIYVSSYGGAEEYWLEESFISKIAQEQGGVIYGVQPRFYGNSRPTPDLSLESLQLLTINQTIADLVGFTRYLRDGFDQSVKFISFGYDTGANLAIYAHQHNPGLFDGVWASGAPIQILFEFDLYFYDIQISVDHYFDERCIEILGHAYEELDQLYSAGAAARITELFDLAQEINLNETKQVDVLFFTSSLWVANHFEWGVERGRIAFCQSITQSLDNGATDLEALTTYLKPLISGTNLDWDAAIEHNRQTDWNSEASILGDRQLWYSRCTEWSWFQTSQSLPEAARYRFTDYLFTDLCYQVFGITYDEVVLGNNQTSYDFVLDSSLQNVFFTYGGTDPFRLVGVPYDLNLWSRVQVVPGFGKAYELLGTIPAEDVTPEFLAVQANVHAQILTWIGN